MKTQNLRFGEAVKYLANMAGMQPYMFTKQDEEREKNGKNIVQFLIDMLNSIMMN